MSFKNIVTGKYQICAKQLNFMKYAEQLLDSYDLDQIIDEMYRSGGYSEKTLVSYIQDTAKKNGITLVDDIDEDALHDMYKSTEKGLS
jgi:hypothetical protein